VAERLMTICLVLGETANWAIGSSTRVASLQRRKNGMVKSAPTVPMARFWWWETETDEVGRSSSW